MWFSWFFAQERVIRRREGLFGIRVSAYVGVICLCLVSSCGVSKDPVELFELGNYGEAFDLFFERAQAGDLEAANYVGIHYYLGAGVERDFKKSASWFEVAALQGAHDAQKNLGVMYYRGLGVAQDYYRAFGWMYYAHQGGNTEARNYLELMQFSVTPNAIEKAVGMIRGQLQNQEKIINVGR
ncbi:MAG: tetratricopeptide repeat protein [Gammaproteobacteria bacterium]